MYDYFDNRRDQHTENYVEFNPTGIKKLKVFDREILLIKETDSGIEEADSSTIYTISYFKIEKQLRRLIKTKRLFEIFESKLFSKKEIIVNFDTGQFLIKPPEKYDVDKLLAEEFNDAELNWNNSNEGDNIYEKL